MLQPFLRPLFLAGMVLAAAGTAGIGAATAADMADGMTTSYDANTVNRSIKVGLNKSVIIDLPRDARDILVSNPVIADAVIRTPRRIYVTGVAVGQSNVIVFDRAGQQIVSLELEVERDASTLSMMLHRLLPDSDINVEIVSDNIVLSGSVRSAADSRRAEDIANVFGNGGAQAPQGAAGTGGFTASSGAQAPTSAVVNMLNVSGEDQVQLKITVAEVNRSLVKQLGLDWNATNIDIGSLIIGAATHLPIGSSTPNTITGTADIGDSGSLTVTLKALESTGMLRTLAEPTLTAISGESASFLAGGQFPYPTSDSNGGTTIAFKDFGVALAMTPVVLSDGRISLHVKTEVSQLSTENSVSGVPGLAVRRAESTLELPSGGAMVLGGLLQDSVRQTINNVPALGKLPILGALFRSRDFQRNETELVIIATPYLVKPVPRTALALPGQGFATPSDAQSNLFGSLNRIYGGASAKGGGKYQGHVGYIYE